MKKIVAPILIVIGIALIGFATNMRNQIETQQIKMSHAEQQMSHPRPLRPVRDSIASQSNQSIQEKIDSGIATVSNHQQLVLWMEIAGAICLILGIGSLIKRKKR